MRRPISGAVRLALTALALATCAAGCTAGTARAGSAPSLQAETRGASAAAGHQASAAPTRPAATPAAASAAAFHCPCPNLAPGSNPRVLPGPVLIADRNNHRLVEVDPNGRIVWQFPGPGSLPKGQAFIPDDAFFTPNGRYIVATEELNATIALIDVATRRIVWEYGVPGVPGGGPDHLSNPDDAMMMPDGDIITADIKNCRVLILRPPYHYPLHIYGRTDPYCIHQPPTRWGSPNGAFPLVSGHYLITEINGDWVDSLTLGGRVLWSAHPPNAAYPSDTNEVRPGVFLTADYTKPGMVEEFTRAGQVLWRYAPTGRQALNEPSLALPLPNGDILLNDDWNHRVIVVDPRTDAVVWQYGHTGVPGSAPGYLDKPDGVDLAPPYSFTMARVATMGDYPVPAGAPPAPGAVRDRAG